MPHSWELPQSAAIAACWGAFAVVWLVGAAVNLKLSPPVARRGRWFSLAILVFVVLVALAVAHVVSASVWNAVTYRSPWLGLLGLVTLAVSTGFTLWARWWLGTMWTSTAVVKTGHQLRTGGPYRITRHPIYTGLLGMLIGTALLNGIGAWLAGIVAGIIIAQLKLRDEERLLTVEFPDDYPNFRRRVPGLVPFSRVGRR
ncbi:MAG TPA: isoprenylcysteine carboxylmethyltransferase family protein [Mycobacteriales bacterium]|jgi:protein-S-isoprenylcysteine O-methyltransferase Ste14|nr:isoprenylcysteine carboxylmethyltransferase family protein [Mycobacteriales bacterium]